MQPNSPPGFDKYQVSSFAGLNVHAAEEAGNTPPVPAMSAAEMPHCSVDKPS
jgi:hypothetical protein